MKREKYRPLQGPQR